MWFCESHIWTLHQVIYIFIHLKKKDDSKRDKRSPTFEGDYINLSLNKIELMVAHQWITEMNYHYES